jgi:hypothetical protein
MEATYDIHWEACPAGRSGTRYYFGKAQGAGYRGIYSPTDVPTHQNTLFGRELGQSETNYSRRSTNLDKPHRRGKP